MSIQVLVHVQEEIRRLAIAGSVVAPGDFRLAKLVPQLEQLGQKAPVFTKVADGAKRVVESDEKTSSAALLELTMLVSAILYTQGETGAEGVLEPIAPSGFALPASQAQASARVLKPLMEALTMTGPGRLEIIRDAHTRGVFNDLRLIAPALHALDDRSPEIADFVAQQVLPRYGRALFERIRAQFDPGGKGGQVRRLVLMHRLDPEATRMVARAAVEKGSKEIRVTALGYLGESPDDLPILLERVKSRSADERAAAFCALGRSEAPEASEVLSAAFKKDSDLEAAVAPIRASRDPGVMQCAVDAARAHLASLVSVSASDRTAASKFAARMMLLLDVLRGRDDEAVSELLLDVFAERARIAGLKGSPDGHALVLQLASVISEGPAAAQSALVDARDELPAEALGDVFVSACCTRTAGEVFEHFSPQLLGVGVGVGVRVRRGLSQRGEKGPGRDAIYARIRGAAPYVRDTRPVVAKLDPRWLDLAVDLEDLGLIRVFASSQHQGARDLLAKSFGVLAKAAEADGYVTNEAFFEILSSMAGIGHPDTTDALIKVIEFCAERHQDYGFAALARLIPQLPRAEAEPKLDALLLRLPEWMRSNIIDYVSELKRVPLERVPLERVPLGQGL